MTDNLKVSDVKIAVDKAMHPLPVESMDFTACARDDVLKTISYLEEAIEAETTHLDYLKNQKESLLSRAMVENIEKSGEYYLITIPGPLKRNPINSNMKFKEKFPEAYEAIRKQQLQNLEDKYQRDVRNVPHSEITLSIADAKLGKDAVTEFVGFQPQTVKAEVRKMPVVLK